MGTSTGETPNQVTLQIAVPASAAAADYNCPLQPAPFAGTVTSCNYIPVAAITGAASPASRTFNLLNKGAAGSGTKVPATKAMVGGVNGVAFVPLALTNSGTATDLDVAAGDVLVFQSLHVGGTGLADPGGTAYVTLSRD